MERAADGHERVFEEAPKIRSLLNNFENNEVFEERSTRGKFKFVG